MTPDEQNFIRYVKQTYVRTKRLIADARGYSDRFRQRLDLCEMMTDKQFVDDDPVGSAALATFRGRGMPMDELMAYVERCE